MRKKGIILIVFLIGLSIFSYPIISNFFMTKEHHEMIGHYNETIRQLELEQLRKEKEKADEHNKKLAMSETDYVDPFSNNDSNQPLANKSYYDTLQINPAIGYIRIPKISVKLPIYHGTDDKVLSRGVGHLENSSFPTGKEGTHSVLTAHRGLPSAKLFRNLDKLSIGEHFFIHLLDEKFAYEIYDIRIVEPDETDWLQFNEDESLVTLLTCEPYMLNTHRLLVMGHLVPYDEEMMEVNEGDENKYFLSIFLIIVFTLLPLMVFGIFRIRRKGGHENEEK